MPRLERLLIIAGPVSEVVIGSCLLQLRFARHRLYNETKIVIRTVASRHVPKPGPSESATGFNIFVVRTELRVDLERDVVRHLERSGFEVLWRQSVTDEIRDRLATALRTFTWEGLAPTREVDEVGSIIAAFDPDPRTPKPKQARTHPSAKNRRLLNALFARPGRRLPGKPALIQSIFEEEATRRCAHLLLGDELSVIEERGQEIASWFASPHPVIRRLDRHGDRGKVELIEYGGRLAVLKTWRPSQNRFWRNELWGSKSLRHLEEIPPLLAIDENRLVKPYYRDAVRPGRSGSRRMPLHVARAAVEALRKIHEEGYFLQDFIPDNVVFNRRDGVKLVDLEFLQRYPGEIPRFTESYALVGLPPDFVGDIVGAKDRTYDSRWKPLTGVDIDTLLNDPYPLQHLKKWGFSAGRIMGRWKHRLEAIAR